jgi:hypothetical protein
MISLFWSVSTYSYKHSRCLRSQHNTVISTQILTYSRLVDLVTSAQIQESADHLAYYLLHTNTITLRCTSLWCYSNPEKTNIKSIITGEGSVSELVARHRSGASPLSYPLMLDSNRKTFIIYRPCAVAVMVLTSTKHTSPIVSRS